MNVSMLNFKKASFSHIFVILVVLLLFNLIVLKSAVLGLILGVFWLFLFIGGVFGAKFRQSDSNIFQNVFGLFLGLNLIILTVSVFFYLFNLNEVCIALVFLIISVLAFVLMNKPKIKLEIEEKFLKINQGQLKYLVLYIVLFIFSLYLFLVNQSSEAILSPWEVVPKMFFVIYFLMSVILIKIILSQEKNQGNEGFKLILISLHYFLTLIVAVMVYKIGFGFDAFVHQAAEFKLAELGYILPKPLYYFGQYGLVVFLSKILFVPIEWVDKLLVPVLAALALPVTAYYSLKNLFKNKTLFFVNCLLFLVIASPLFFYTVPQSLANLFLLILVFLVFGNLINNKEKNPLWYWLIAGVIFLIHPLAGIPAGIILTLGYFNIETFKHKLVRLLFFILASILVPLFFVAGALITNFDIKLSLSNLSNIGGLFSNLFEYLPFYSVYHLIYLYEYNWLILFILILIAGSYCLIKKGYKKLTFYSWQVAAILLINLIVLGFFEFKSVIDYEQAEFAKRLGQIIILVVSPLFLIGLYWILGKIIEFKKGNWIVIILVAGILTVSLYLSYPHDDAFNKARGYCVSKYDIQAVKWINQSAGDGDYIVLANQSTSAASLQEFGFYRYYLEQESTRQNFAPQNLSGRKKTKKPSNSAGKQENKNQQLSIKNQQLFYYPIPTSSPLYEIYLKMVYDGPSLEYINQARELSGVRKVYFVINDYWLDSKKRVVQAREIADFEMSFEDKIWVFGFE